MNSFLVAFFYAVAGIVVVPIIFSIFKTKYGFLDVVLASIGAAAVSLIPTIGGPASLATMIAILYWRIREDLVPDIVVAVGVARLAVIPLLLVFNLKSQ